MRDRNAALEVVLAAFLRSKRLEKRSEQTVAWYETSLRHFAEWLRAEGRSGVVGDLDPEIVRAYMEHRRVHGRRMLVDGRAANGSEHQARAFAVAAKSFATYLACEGILGDDATTFCRRCRRIHKAPILVTLAVPQVDDSTRDELSAAEVEAAIAKAGGTRNPRRNELILRLALTGLRKREISGLRLRDLDHERGTIFVRPDFAKYGRRRTMTLWPEVATALDRYVIERRGPEEPYSALLLKDDGTPLTYAGISSLFDDLGVSAHRCRHTGVSGYFRARSGSTVDAKREFGWKDDRMAERYDHVRPAEERLARPSPFSGFRGATRRQEVFSATRRQEVFSAKRTPNAPRLEAV